MMKVKEKVCKICRRLGTKLLLKGEKCFSAKCVFLRKPYPPGFGLSKRRKMGLSDFGRILREKQKFKNWYHLKERELKNLVKRVLREKENPSERLIQLLELRLENIVFSSGFASSRKEARQLISHRFFKVNGKIVNFPSFLLKVGDVVSLNEKKLTKKNIERIKKRLEKVSLPDFLKKEDDFSLKLTRLPSMVERSLPVDLEYIFEFYSK
ncbi:MAG: 30S ribosomal protein S4 [Minisyncoccales bacterium]